MNVQVSGETVRGEGNEELSLSFPAPYSRVSFRVPLARDFSRYSLNGVLVSRLLGYYCYERWLHCHHNGSVNFKSTSTPESIC